MRWAEVNKTGIPGDRRPAPVGGESRCEGTPPACPWHPDAPGFPRAGRVGGWG